MADQNDDGSVPSDAPDNPLGVALDAEVPPLVPDAESTIGQPGEALEELLPALERTGHDGVDAALATLEDLADRPVDEHVAVFDAVHDELRRTLDQADQADQGDPSGAGVPSPGGERG